MLKKYEYSFWINVLLSPLYPFYLFNACSSSIASIFELVVPLYQLYCLYPINKKILFWILCGKGKAIVYDLQ